MPRGRPCCRECATSAVHEHRRQNRDQVTPGDDVGGVERPRGDERLAARKLGQKDDDVDGDDGRRHRREAARAPRGSRLVESLPCHPPILIITSRWITERSLNAPATNATPETTANGGVAGLCADGWPILLAGPDAEAVPIDFGIERSQADDVRVVSHAVKPLEHPCEIVVLLTHCVDRKRRVLDTPPRRLTDCGGCRRARQLVRRDVDSLSEEPLTAFDDEGGELRDIRDRDLLQTTRRRRAWHAAHQLVLLTYRVTKNLPREELYGLTSQARRAAFSVAANIAEGSAKKGPREFRRYLDIAVGSLSELAYIFQLVKDLELIEPTK